MFLLVSTAAIFLARSAVKLGLSTLYSTPFIVITASPSEKPDLGDLTILILLIAASSSSNNNVTLERSILSGLNSLIPVLTPTMSINGSISPLISFSLKL